LIPPLSLDENTTLADERTGANPALLRRNESETGRRVPPTATLVGARDSTKTRRWSANSIGVPKAARRAAPASAPPLTPAATDLSAANGGNCSSLTSGAPTGDAVPPAGSDRSSRATAPGDDSDENSRRDRFAAATLADETDAVATARACCMTRETAADTEPGCARGRLAIAVEPANPDAGAKPKADTTAKPARTIARPALRLLTFRRRTAPTPPRLIPRDQREKHSSPRHGKTQYT
jgi:hypothetical protein